MKTITISVPIILVAFLALLVGLTVVGCDRKDSTSKDSTSDKSAAGKSTSKSSDTLDITKNRSDICHIHKIKMTKASAGVMYGLPSPRVFEEIEIAEKKFPFAEQYVLGGCVAGDDFDVIVFHCSECIKAKKLWLEQNKKSEINKP